MGRAFRDPATIRSDRGAWRPVQPCEPCATTLSRTRSNGFPRDSGRSFEVFAGEEQSDPAQVQAVVGESSQGGGLCRRLTPLPASFGAGRYLGLGDELPNTLWRRPVGAVPTIFFLFFFFFFLPEAGEANVDGADGCGEGTGHLFTE